MPRYIITEGQIRETLAGLRPEDYGADWITVTARTQAEALRKAAKMDGGAVPPAMLRDRARMEDASAVHEEQGMSRPEADELAAREVLFPD